MHDKKGASLFNVKQYVEETNRILTNNKLSVVGRYKVVDDIRCVEVTLDGGFIYPYRIELLCDYTNTCLHAITKNSKGNLSLLLVEKTE